MTDAPKRQFGQYELGELIGSGGMASVYRAYQPSFNRYVAIKELLPVLSMSPGFTARFQREVKIIAALEHPNIVPVYDFGQHDNTTYLVMRLVEGGSLDKKIANSQMPLREVARLLDQIASALAYAHSKGVVHRDLKPSNVLLDQQGNSYLTDFGIAKSIAEQSAEQGTNLTATGVIVGTPDYMSPEQWSAEPVDQRADVYALGIMLFKMLTGHVPFKANSVPLLMQMHMLQQIPSAVVERPELPPEVDTILLAATAKRPADRYDSATELAEDFRDAVAHLITRGATSGTQGVARPGRLYGTSSTPPPGTGATPTPTPLIPADRTVTPTPRPVGAAGPRTSPPAAPSKRNNIVPAILAVAVGLIVVGVSFGFALSKLQGTPAPTSIAAAASREPTIATASPAAPTVAAISTKAAVVVVPTLAGSAAAPIDTSPAVADAATRTALKATSTDTPSPRAATSTPKPAAPTVGALVVPPPTRAALTHTPIPASATVTSEPPTLSVLPTRPRDTSTSTLTPIPPTLTPTPSVTSVPPTLSPTPLPPTLTNTPQPTATFTPIPPTLTSTAAPTLTSTPSLTTTFTASPSSIPTLTPTAAATFTPVISETPAPPTQAAIGASSTVNPAAMQSAVLNYGDTIEGVIDRDRSVTRWKFRGSFGDRVQITMQPTSGSLIPLVRIVDSQGQYVDWNDSSGTLVTQPLPRDDEYTIIAARRNLENGTTTGSFTLNLSLLQPGQRPTETPAPTFTPSIVPTLTPSLTVTPSPTTVRDLYYGEVVASLLPSADSVDQWTFTGAAEDSVSIQTESLQSKDKRFAVTLRGPGLPNAADMTSPQGVLSGVRLASAGKYTILVGGQSGQYTLTLTRAQPSGQVTKAPDGFMKYGDTVRGPLNSNTPEVNRTFYGHAGDVVTILARSVSDNLDPVLELFDPNNVSIATNDDIKGDRGAGVENFRLPTDGVYHIQVTRYPGKLSGGTYQLSLSLLPPRVPAVATYPPTELLLNTDSQLRYGDTRTGHLGPGQVDSYSFLGRAGDTVKALIIRKSDNLEPTLRLVDNTTNEVLYQANQAEHGTPLDSLQPRVLQHSGKYTLTAGTKSYASNSGDYLIDLSLSPAYPVLTPDQTETGIVSDQFPQRPYTFQGVAGQHIQLTARAGLTSKLDSFLLLLAPNGHLITFADSLSANDPTAVIDGPMLLETGMYTVLVTRPGGEGGQSVGEFKLSLHVLDDPPATAWQTPTSFLAGGGVAGEFADQGTHSWNFNANAGDVILFRTDRNFGEGTQVISNVTDPEGRPIQPMSPVGAQATYQFQTQGTYRVQVSGANSQYTLWGQLLRNQPPLPEFIGINAPDAGSSLSPNTSAVLKVAGKAADQISLIVFWLPESGRNVFVTWTGPDGKAVLLPYEASLTSARLNQTLTSTGLYLVTIDNRSGNTIRFTVQLSGSTPPPTATPLTTSLTSGQVMTGNLQPAGAQIYQFLGRAGQRLHLAVEMLGAGASPAVQVIKPDGAALEANVQNGNGYSTVDVELPFNGQYNVNLISTDPGATGQYRFTFALTDPQAPPTPTIEATLVPISNLQPTLLTPGVPAAGQLITQGESRFTFEGIPGQSALISLFAPSIVPPVPVVGATPWLGNPIPTSTPETFFATVSVYDPDGAFVGEASTTGATDRGTPVLNVPIHKPGAYTIAVRGRGAPRDQGSFYITLIGVAPNPTPTTSPINYLPFEEVQFSSLRAGETAAWRYQPKTSSALIVMRPRPGSALRAALDVYTREGFLEATGSAAKAGDEVRVPITKLSSLNDYRIVIRSLDNTAGEYALYASGSLGGLVVFGTKNVSIRALDGPDFNRFAVQINVFGNNYEAFGRSPDGLWLLMRNPDPTRKQQYIWVLLRDVGVTYGDPGKLPIEQPVK